MRNRVTSGEWPPGSALPSESDLAKEYKVALGTMRQAIACAVEDGLLERVHGKGTFVRSELQDALMFRFFRFRDLHKSGCFVMPNSRDSDAPRSRASNSSG